MNLTFLNPLFLLGLAAAILPILIHRLTRRRAIIKKFSAVRLLIKSQQVMTKPQRLKHFFLLALRVLAVMGLVFSMARPLLVRPGLISLENGSATVIILDNSLSMGYREDNGKRFDIARSAAREIVRKLNGEIAFLSTSSFRKEPRWMSREEALQELERTPLSYGRGDPLSALSAGYRLLKEMKKTGEILILGDMARGDWEGFDPGRLGTVPSETRMSFLRFGGPNRDSNFAVKELNLIEGEPVVGVPARMEVTLSNLSDQPGEILVQLYLSQTKKDQKSVAIKAREQAKVYFELFFDRPGWTDGEIRISGDRLSSDDTSYFSINAREKIKALVVDGDPRTSLKASESYYLVNALYPGGADTSPFQTKVVTEGEFAYSNTDSYGVVLFLNVARPPISRILSILESGRPVFIFLGDRIIPEEYNGFPLSPWRVREMKETESLGITKIDHSRPILKSISGAGGESLQTASFRRYFRIEGNAKVLLTLRNGDPLLIEAGMGKGKIFLFASSADLDWNDFPLKAAYLPLVQGLLKEAVGLADGKVLKGFRIGDSPDEKMASVQAGNPEIKPGIYRSSLASGEVRWSINPPVEESDLSKVSPEEMKKRLGKIDMQVVQYREDILNEAHSGRREIWPFLLCFVLLVLGLEMVVAGRV
jgi:hypothetical protein